MDLPHKFPIGTTVIVTAGFSRGEIGEIVDYGCTKFGEHSYHVQLRNDPNGMCCFNENMIEMYHDPDERP